MLGTVQTPVPNLPSWMMLCKLSAARQTGGLSSQSWQPCWCLDGALATGPLWLAAGGCMEPPAPAAASQHWDPIESHASPCPFPASWSTLFPFLAPRAMRACVCPMCAAHGTGRKQHSGCYAHRHIGHLHCI